jgi:long-chain acyl-CoA synthetase
MLIPHYLIRLAKEHPSTPAYAVMKHGQWQVTTWRYYVEQIRNAAKSMIALGVKPGQRVAILGFNRPEWAIFDHAAMMVGAAPAGIYTTCSPDEVGYIVAHSESPLLLVENHAQLAKVTAMRAGLPDLLHVVLMQDSKAHEGALDWDQFMAVGSSVPDSDLDLRIDKLQQADLATLIYTSGTTGPPKAVMLSHENLRWTAQTLLDLGAAASGDCLVSYLPLSHVAEQMATLHLPALSGAAVHFAESMELLAGNIRTTRPTIFFGVPRIWEKFHAAMSTKMAAATGVKKALLAWARKTSLAYHELQDAGKPVPWALQMQQHLARKLVFQKVKVALGFDRVRSCVSGAAPIAPEILKFFASIDIPIREIYGQSEDTGPTSYNMQGRTKIGSVGSPIPGISVRIADDGEIMISGPNVFMGYLKDQAATDEVLKDGWLASGDLGELDSDGYLTVTGRKKEIIITAGGKNITPKNIEAAIKRCAHVADAVVIGDKQKFLTVLLTLHPDAQPRQQEPMLASEIQVAIDAANAQLARVEQVKKFTILPAPFSIETGEYTPTLKLRRSEIAKKYAPQIAAMYSE